MDRPDIRCSGWFDGVYPELAEGLTIGCDCAMHSPPYLDRQPAQAGKHKTVCILARFCRRLAPTGLK